MAVIMMPATKGRSEWRVVSDQFWWPGVYEDVNKVVIIVDGVNSMEGRRRLQWSS